MLSLFPIKGILRQSVRLLSKASVRDVVAGWARWSASKQQGLKVASGRVFEDPVDSALRDDTSRRNSLQKGAQSVATRQAACYLL